MRVLLVLLALALAVPAQAQARFLETCTAQAGADLPDGMDAGALCGCSARKAMQEGIPGADLDALMDHLGPDGNLSPAGVPEALQPAAEATAEAVMGCAIQVGFAEVMEGAMQEALAEGMGEAMAEGMGEALAGLMAAGPEAEALPVSEDPAAIAGLPAELAARIRSTGAPAPTVGGAPTDARTAPEVSPDGTVSSAPRTRAARVDIPGIRTGAGRAPVRAVQASKGAAIRILE